MLETASDPALRARRAALRLARQAPGRAAGDDPAAGELRIPFTTGILIGIGETREERIEALLAIRELHERYGHIQEVIVQNFRAKAGTKMVDAPEPSLDELLWTAAAARLVLGADMNIQAPPNLSYDDFPRLLDAGINDWGGVSPVTIDHVNPEAPWPELERLEAATRAAGLELAARLPVYPEYVDGAWIDPKVMPRVLQRPIRLAWPGRASGRRAPRLRSRSFPVTHCPSTRAMSSARRRSCGCSAPGAASETVCSLPPIACDVR